MTEKLAIDGGKPVLGRTDFGNWPIIGADERRLINEVLDKGIVAGGTAPQVKALEQEWARYTGSQALPDDVQRNGRSPHGACGRRCRSGR